MPIVTTNRYRWIKIDGESFKVPAVLLEEMEHARALLEVATANTEVDNDDAWHDAKNEWLADYPFCSDIGSEKGKSDEQ
jgi:hypothetical protein